MKDIEIINRLFDLLGKSEKSNEVKQVCAELGIEQPLPRADYAGYVSYTKIIPHLEFKFTHTEKLPEYKDNAEFMEGELIFSGIFVWANEVVANDTLPLQLVFGMSKADVVKLYSEPEWKRPIDNTYRWTIGALKITLSFDDDNNNLDRIVYSVPHKFHLKK